MTPLSRSRSIVPRALSIILAAAPAGTFLLAPTPVHAVDVLQPGSEEVNALFEKAKPSIVQVESGDEGLVLAGTGFFIDKQGTVLTSSTIIGDNTSARVTVNGLKMDAKILGTDPRSGLAMLRVSLADTDVPFLTLGHSADLKTGNGVVAIGYPLNLPLAPVQGPVTGFEVRCLNRFFATTHIHADIPISPGQVGGPLLGAHGEVVGMVMPSPDDGRSVFALPVEAMEKIMTDFEQYGRARHGWVGVNVMEVPDIEHDGRTVRVVQVVPGTPASKSGLMTGDTVMRIDSREVYRPADVLDASFFSHVGGNMTVVVRRDDELQNYTFAVIERPLSPPDASRVSNGPVRQPILVNHAVVHSP